MRVNEMSRFCEWAESVNEEIERRTEIAETLLTLYRDKLEKWILEAFEDVKV